MSQGIPKIFYGTAWKKEKTTDFVVEAIRNGFRAIDTACQQKHYQEDKVGDALQILQREGINRQDIFLQTKFTPLEGQDPNNVPYDKDATLQEQVKQSFKTSKKNLQTGYIDSFILHSPLFPSSKLYAVWDVMEEIYKSGEVLYLGISNCYELSTLQKLYNHANIKPKFVQNRFYADSEYDKDIRAWCLCNGMIYQSFWTLTANPHILESKIIIKLAFKYKKTPPQILFNYLSHKGIIPLSGTTSTKHMLEDIAALNFIMDDEEYDSISTLF